MASTVPLSGLNPNGYCASVITSLLSAHEINLLFKIEVKRFVIQLIKLTERFKQVIVFQLITFQYNLHITGCLNALGLSYTGPMWTEYYTSINLFYTSPIH